MTQNQTIERILGVILHLSGFLNGFFPIVVPLLIWWVKKDESYFLKAHGKEALNFQITVLILGILATIFTFLTFGLGALLVAPISLILFCFYVYFLITAAIAAYQGKYYVYPFSFKFFS